MYAVMALSGKVVVAISMCGSLTHYTAARQKGTRQAHDKPGSESLDLVKKDITTLESLLGRL